jgi:hypothetical protein
MDDVRFARLGGDAPPDTLLQSLLRDAGMHVTPPLAGDWQRLLEDDVSWQKARAALMRALVRAAQHRAPASPRSSAVALRRDTWRRS